MALVVKEITGLLEVDINPSSPLYKAATKCYNLVKLKKNSRLRKEKFLKTEKETLEKYMVMFEVHMRPRVMEAIWNASIDKMLMDEPCTRGGLPCTSHPHLVAKTRGTRATACEAKEIIKRLFQKQF